MHYITHLCAACTDSLGGLELLDTEVQGLDLLVLGVEAATKLHGPALLARQVLLQGGDGLQEECERQGWHMEQCTCTCTTTRYNSNSSTNTIDVSAHGLVPVAQ